MIQLIAILTVLFSLSPAHARSTTVFACSQEWTRVNEKESHEYYVDRLPDGKAVLYLNRADWSSGRGGIKSTSCGNEKLVFVHEVGGEVSTFAIERLVDRDYQLVGGWKLRSSLKPDSVSSELVAIGFCFSNELR